MKLLAQKGPLTEAELDRLAEFLASTRRSRTISIEELDGFFAALVVGPEIVMPSEYLPEIIGSRDDAFESLEDANELLELLMRHWNAIAGTLARNEVYLPLLLEDADGVAHGNEWTRGFMRGVALRADSWKELFADEDHAGCLVPMLVLYHENDEDATLRPPPITSKQREKLLPHMVAGLLAAHRYFREHRGSYGSTSEIESRQTGRRIGRNDPCPCGSGKKWKRCCGASVH